MTATREQLLALSLLIGKCEGIALAGYLPEATERHLRELIVDVCQKFKQPTIAERAVNSNATPDEQLAAVAAEMARS